MRKSLATMTAMAAVLGFSPAVSAAAGNPAAAPDGYIRFCNTGATCVSRPVVEGPGCRNIDVGAPHAWVGNRSNRGQYIYHQVDCAGPHRAYAAPGTDIGGFGTYRSYGDAGIPMK
ncbi:hypothetical protein ACFWMR_01560 [Amycolatopsis thailandensis]|uniref:hypothetical protein n=1 Tax=Amycolatopsis thailandensis TaxID=589330 RepID=UPI0036672F63